MEIKQIEVPEELREALGKLAEKLTGIAEKQDVEQTFKTELADVCRTAVMENDLDPVTVVRHLMVMAAITMNNCCSVRQGHDPRKVFRKLSGYAFDKSVELKQRAKAKSE